MADLQATRTRLRQQGKRLPSVETELQKVRDQIAFLEDSGRKEALISFDSFERERRWLEEVHQETDQLAAKFDDVATTIDEADLSVGGPPDNTPTASWLVTVAERVHAAQVSATSSLRDHARGLRTLRETIMQEQGVQWQASYDEARRVYDALKQEMTSRGVDFAQHEKLLQRRAQLEREVALLQKTEQELEETDRKLRDAHLRLMEAHEFRLAARRTQAQTLEAMDTDVRLDVLGFRDREDFESRRDQWFGGAGLQERDWTALCDHVFAPSGQIPERIFALVEAIRVDVLETASRSAPIDLKDSKVAGLIGGNRLTRHFFRVLEKDDRVPASMNWSVFYQMIWCKPRYASLRVLSRRLRPAP